EGSLLRGDRDEVVLLRVSGIALDGIRVSGHGADVSSVERERARFSRPRIDDLVGISCVRLGRRLVIGWSLLRACANSLASSVHVHATV
ncbi:hypothetical protein PMAYCL1PPCAC_27260, partial [Pristionchus mayeri]